MNARQPTTKAPGRTEQLVLPTPATPPKGTPKRGGRTRAPEEAAKDYIRRRAKPSVVPGHVKLTFTLDMPRELASGAPCKSPARRISQAAKWRERVLWGAGPGGLGRSDKSATAVASAAGGTTLALLPVRLSDPRHLLVEKDRVTTRVLLAD
jgi:hypothetical protein